VVLEFVDSRQWNKLLEVKLCLEEMEPGLLEEVVQEQEEELVVGEEVEVEWGGHAPGLDPEGSVYALIVELRFPTK